MIDNVLMEMGLTPTLVVEGITKNMSSEIPSIRTYENKLEQLDERTLIKLSLRYICNSFIEYC